MGESYEYQHQQVHRRRQQPAVTGTSRNSGGEIVEVQGGHIVRATGRKDRHSKVCTAKGPRDRRVRLSAHTAIQFYDVQDRLGYDRPSKAVDWLIKKAKSAIDKLAELPAWKPTATTAGDGTNSASILSFEQNPDEENTNHHELSRFEQHPENSSFLPPSLDSDSIADTIKSFFPMGASSTPVNTNSSANQFHQQSQDLKLSLQSFKEEEEEGNNNMFLDGSGWSERMVNWGGNGNGNGDDAVSGGFVYTSPSAQTTPFLQTLLYNSNNSQRGPLQSSFTPSIRAWIDQPPFAGAAIHHSSSEFTSTGGGGGGFSGFFIPAPVQGEQQEEHDGISDKPSSASSDSRH